MESVTKPEVDLFGDKLPSIEEIKTVSESVHSSDFSQQSFRDRVESHANERSANSHLSVGIGLYILGKYGDATDRLDKGTDCGEKFYYMGLALREKGAYEDAINSFDKAIKAGLDEMTGKFEKIATYREMREYEKAEELLNSCKNLSGVSSDYHYQLARLEEAKGEYVTARENYEQAVELSPENKNALFHLAYRCDLSGDEEAALDYYRQLISENPMNVNALLNLAVIYEDREEWNKASQCVEMILEAHPNHKRAELFYKDIESSKTMFYDEEKAKKRDKKNKILETPISDFELSVRSRNCLKKMNINTIGDLLNINEAELLSYKNFGETSLKEIKRILETKGLYLGMHVDDVRQKRATEKLVSKENEGILSKPVTELNLSVRAKKCLEKLNMHALGDLTQRTEAELLGCKNFGVTSLNEIKKALGTFGLSLRKLD